MKSVQSQRVIDPGYRPLAGQQKEFHDDRYDVFARLISASTGGGKTEAGLYEAWLWTWECPGSVGYIFEPTYPMLRRILLPKMERRFGSPIEACPAITEYHKTENRITWVNGSRWWLVGLDDPESAEGPDVDWIWADEFRLVGGSGPSARRKQETAWNVFMRRLRGSVPGRYPVGIWVTTTPDAVGSVAYEKFEDPEKRLPNSKIYRWSIDANPFLTEDYKREVKTAHVPGSGLYKRFVLGLFAAVASGSFAYDSTLHELKDVPDKAVIRRMVYGVDWGWSNPACIVAVGFDGDNRAYILEEFYQSKASLETLISAGREMQEMWGLGSFICDRSEPRSIQEFREAGLDAVADKSKRGEGIRMLGGRFQVVGDGRPRIFVYKSCVNWISEAQVYDATKKVFDHAMDATRYALASLMEREGPIDAFMFR